MKNIPTIESMKSSTFDLLHFSFDQAIEPYIYEKEHLSNLNEEEQKKYIKNESALYLEAHNKKMNILICHIFQAIEVYIKSLISEVDFEQIISEDSLKKDDFNDCITIAPLELIQKSKDLNINIPNKTKTYFKKLRKDRNSIIHNSYSIRKYTPLDIILIILELNSEIFIEKNWLQYRLEWKGKSELRRINDMFF